MKLRNTLSRQIEELKPLVDSNVRLYTCGPTVYDKAHIGNLGTFIFADTLRRVIRSQGYDVYHVMNITDIDDKTVSRSHKLFPDLEPMQALKKLTDDCLNSFITDMKAVGNKVEPEELKLVRATENIRAMQALIINLHEKGFAYIADDGIYFSISTYTNSGKVYGQLSEVSASTTSQARIDNDEYDKESAHDFALWKAKKENEPAWDFNIDGTNIAGRPGWHIECSAMSTKYLEQPFDLHSGGVDLIFPHHENEIAQSTAGRSSKTYSKMFIHSEHLLVDSKKMSKSLNNFYTVQNIKDKGYDPLAFRLLVLQSHYTNQVHFSWENMEAANNRLQELKAMAVLRYQPRSVAHDSGTFALEDVPLQLSNILAEDLDTPQCLAYLSSACTQLLTVHIQKDMVDHFENMLQRIDDLLGLDLMSVKDINDSQKGMIAKREAARSNKDWLKADEIRAELKSQGVGLEDHDHGVIWYPA
jgi:cysteinyl-tRNA synthetase